MRAPRIVLSPLVPMLLFAATVPLWFEKSALSSIRAAYLVTTVLTKEDTRIESIDSTAEASLDKVMVEDLGMNQARMEAVNVLYGLSGTNKDFLVEFETCISQERSPQCATQFGPQNSCLGRQGCI